MMATLDRNEELEVVTTAASFLAQRRQWPPLTKALLDLNYDDADMRAALLLMEARQIVLLERICIALERITER